MLVSVTRKCSGDFSMLAGFTKTWQSVKPAGFGNTLWTFMSLIFMPNSVFLLFGSCVSQLCVFCKSSSLPVSSKIKQTDKKNPNPNIEAQQMAKINEVKRWTKIVAHDWIAGCCVWIACVNPVWELILFICVHPHFLSPLWIWQWKTLHGSYIRETKRMAVQLPIFASSSSHFDMI